MASHWFRLKNNAIAPENKKFNHSSNLIYMFLIIFYSHITENVPSQGLNLFPLISFRALLAYEIDLLSLINSHASLVANESIL